MEVNAVTSMSPKLFVGRPKRSFLSLTTSLIIFWLSMKVIGFCCSGLNEFSSKEQAVTMKIVSNKFSVLFYEDLKI